MTDDLAKGVAAFQAGDLTRARDFALRALASDPGSPLAHHIVGLVDCHSGDVSRGVESLRRAVDADPGNTQFRLMLARALVDSGRATEALDAASPSSAGEEQIPLWFVRAEAARSAGRLDVESEAWRALADIRPNDIRLWISLGRSLLAQSRFDEAEEAYRKALAINPTELVAIYEIGVTLERTSQIDALGELLEGALAAGVDKDHLPELWAARDLRQGNAGAALDRLRQSHARSASAYWSRLKTKAADLAGSPEEAFAAATAMNRAVEGFRQWRDAAAAYRRGLRELAETMTPQWAERLPRPEGEVGQPIAFLVGFPRSGTTLLDTFLMGHDRCQVLEELPLLIDAAVGLGPVAHLDGASCASVEEARRDYLEQLRSSVDVRKAGLIVDKFPLNMLSAPLIHALFPSAPIIFAQRHPCDVVLSGFMQNFAPSIGMASFLDIEDAADFYDCAMALWCRSRELLHLDVQLVVYEELVQDPEAVLRRLLPKLGLEWQDKLLDHRSTARKRGPIRNTSYDQVTESITTQASGRWKRYAEQLAPVLPVLLPWAERLGYAPAPK